MDRERAQRAIQRRIERRQEEAHRRARAKDDPKALPQDADPGRPPWIPYGVDLKVIPAEVRQAIDDVVVPIYRELVVKIADPLERSLGVTLVHLLWLETLQQNDLKREYTQTWAVLGLPIDSGNSLAGHLRLIDSKIRAGALLLRLRKLTHRQQPLDEGNTNSH